MMEVIKVRDVITFEGTTVDEVQTAFRDSVDDYLDFLCPMGRVAREAVFGEVRPSPIRRVTP